MAWVMMKYAKRDTSKESIVLWNQDTSEVLCPMRLLFARRSFVDKLSATVSREFRLLLAVWFLLQLIAQCYCGEENCVCPSGVLYDTLDSMILNSKSQTSLA